MGRLYVEPSVDDVATMCREQHERINEQLYASGDGIERVDRPLVIKLGSAHLAVHGQDGVPADTIAIPESILDESTIRNPPSLREILLAKADRATQLLNYMDGRIRPGQDVTNVDGPIGR